MFVVVVLVAVAVLAFAHNRNRVTAPRPEVGPLGWVADTNWSVVRPLARVEMRRLALHPAFVAGIVLTALIFWAGTTESGHDWSRVSTLIALALAPLGWFIIVATHLVMGRPARTGADELFASLPAPQPVRTTGALTTMAVTVPVALGIALVEVLWISRLDWRMTGSPQPLEIGAGLLLAAGAVAVGVSLGRYFPHPLFGVAGAIIVITLQARFEEASSWPWNREESHPIRFVGFLGGDTSAPSVLEYRPAAWHLVYLLGLVTLMVFVALARNGFARPVVVGLGVAVVVTLLGGVMQLQPAPASRVASMVRYLERPDEHQTCERVGGDEYCYFEGNEIDGAMWREVAKSVRALLPPAAQAQTFTVRERVPTIVGSDDCTPTLFPESLVKDVAETIDVDKVWADDGAIHPSNGVGNCGEAYEPFYVAVQVGSHVVGLPSSVRANDVRCHADGQERAVFALWLGAAATSRGERELRTLVREGGDYIAFDGWTDPPPWGVRFAVADAVKALALLERPVAEVKAELAAKWPQLQAATGTTTGRRCA